MTDRHDPEGRMALRVPFPQADATDRGLTRAQWNALLHLFPAVEDAATILAAHDWAQVRGLSALKGHVAIVRQSVNRQPVDQFWLTQKGLLFTAHANADFGGIDEVIYGPATQESFTGMVKKDGAWSEITADCTCPAHARITVFKFVQGARCAFTAKLLFRETVPRMGSVPAQGDRPAHFGVPPRMWLDRPFLMLRKCVLAAALREAWPDIDLTEDEIRGRDSLPGAEILAFPAAQQPRDPAALAPQGESTPVDGGAGEPPASDGYSAMEPEALAWLRHQLETALQTQACQAALVHLRTGLDPRHLALGEGVIRAAETVQNSDRIATIGPWLNRAIRQMPQSHEQAVRHALGERDRGRISDDLAAAIRTLLAFHHACALRLGAVAA